MHCTLDITQCTCTACGHSWITSSAHTSHAGTHYGANTQEGTKLIKETPPPVPISHVWDWTITYPRCFRCVTIDELSNNPVLPAKPTSPKDITDVPEL